MAEVIKKYSNDDITVIWQPSKCSHAAVCAKQLSQVFNPKKRPWVDMQGSDSEAIVATVRKCPSGALSIEGDAATKDEVAGKEQGGNTAITVYENGPAVVAGTVEMTLADGSTKMLNSPALCRCGASANKPFCDGSHSKINFMG